VDNIVNTVLACDIAVGVEKAGGEVGARVHGDGHRSKCVVAPRRSLGTAERAFDGVASADAELVVVLREWGETGRFDFDRVVNVGRGIGLAARDDMAQIAVGRHGVRNTDRILANPHVLLCVVVVQGNSAGDRDVAAVVIHGWARSRPEDDRVRVRVAARNAMGEVDRARIHVRSTSLSFHEFRHGNAKVVAW